MTWADKARSCVDWGKEDHERLARLHAWLQPECEDVIDDLLERLSVLNGAQPVMRNVRFAQRLRRVIREWLAGLVEEPFADGFAQNRRALGQRLADLDLAFEDVVFLEGVAFRQLFSLARGRLQGQPEELSLTMCALQKAMTQNRALVYAGYLDLHDAELEQALLDRFLTITGFSPSLYEGLAQTWQWNQEHGR